MSIRDVWLVLTGRLSSYDLQQADDRTDRLEKSLEAIELALKALSKRIIPTLDGIGRVLANDKSFIGKYDDPKLRAESDALGARAIERLVADDAARRHTTGGL